MHVTTMHLSLVKLLFNGRAPNLCKYTEPENPNKSHVVLLQSHAASPGAERREHLYKILVIGELGTGKTSIIKRYVHQFFSQHYRATIGVDFALKVLNWDANTIIRLQLWDIAGLFLCLRKFYTFKWKNKLCFLCFYS